jgi:hypothetical protein
VRAQPQPDRIHKGKPLLHVFTPVTI